MAYGSAIYKSVGSVASGTTGLSVTYPAGIVEGNLVVMCTVWKASSGSPSMNTPSGWQQQDTGYTQFNAGQGTQGNVDVGPVHSSIFYRIATGSLTGSVTLGWSSAVSSCQSVILVFSKPLDCEWGSMFGLCGYDVAYGTSWSSINVNTLTLKPNETILTCLGINTDAYSYTSRSFTQSGLSISNTNRVDNGTDLGTDQRIMVNEHKVTSGTSGSSSWNYTMTSTGSSSLGNPTGVVIGMVIRVVPYKILKRWTGSVWRRAPLRSWNGSNWQYSAANYSRPLKRWSGSSWQQISSLFVYPDPSTYNITSDAQVLYPTIFNGHETDITISDGWISLIYATDVKVHKNAFALGLNILGNGGAARTGYVYFWVDGVTYKTLTINQDAYSGPSTMYWDYPYLDFDYNGNACQQSWNDLYTDATDWQISYIDQGYDTWWGSVNPESGSSNTQVNISTSYNSGAYRTMGVYAYSQAYPSLNSQFNIIQYAQYDGCV